MDEGVRNSLITLLTEVFEGIHGNGTWFVDTGKDERFFGRTDVSAAVASWNPGPGLNSIAAHTIHIRFAVSLHNLFARGEKPTMDWEGSWKIQAVDEAAWAEIRRTLRAEYEEVKGHFATRGFENPDSVTSAFALVAHVAFHLGAIKHLRAFATRTSRPSS